MVEAPPLERLQLLLSELFQLDLADLDFGIYRHFHLKRDEVERLINDQLPRTVGEAYDRVLINGGSGCPRVDSLDPLFKRLMENEERWP